MDGVLDGMFIAAHIFSSFHHHFSESPTERFDHNSLSSSPFPLLRLVHALLLFAILLMIGSFNTAPRPDTSLQTYVVRSNQLLVHLLNRLEVVDRLDMELQRRVLVTDNHSTRMQLDRRDRPHVVDTFLDTFRQRQSLVRACNNHAYFSSVHHRAVE